MYSARKLEDLSAIVVAKNLRKEDDVQQLHVPNVLREKVKRTYMYQQLLCDEGMPPLDRDEVWFDFGEPWVDCGTDIVCTLRRWPHDYGEVDFGHPYTWIHRLYFDVYHAGRIAQSNLCNNCMLIHIRRMERLIFIEPVITIYKYYADDWCYEQDLLNEITPWYMWCSNCWTRNLFYITPAPCKFRENWAVVHRIIGTYTHSKVDGQWRTTSN